MLDLRQQLLQNAQLAAANRQPRRPNPWNEVGPAAASAGLSALADALARRGVQWALPNAQEQAQQMLLERQQAEQAGAGTLADALAQAPEEGESRALALHQLAQDQRLTPEQRSRVLEMSMQVRQQSRQRDATQRAIAAASGLGVGEPAAISRAVAEAGLNSNDIDWNNPVLQKIVGVHEQQQALKMAIEKARGEKEATLPYALQELTAQGKIQKEIQGMQNAAAGERNQADISSREKVAGAEAARQQAEAEAKAIADQRKFMADKPEWIAQQKNRILQGMAQQAATDQGRGGDTAFIAQLFARAQTTPEMDSAATAQANKDWEDRVALMFPAQQAPSPPQSMAEPAAAPPTGGAVPPALLAAEPQRAAAIWSAYQSGALTPTEKQAVEAIIGPAR